MDSATSFMPLLQVFTAVMTEPTGESFRQLVAGWIFAPRRNISGALRATDPTKHHSAYHRIFANARWSIDQVGLAIFDLVVKLTDQDSYYLVGDDTLIHKTGLKVYDAGMHRDACQSSSGYTSFRWGHCWVVLCVLVPSRKDPSRKYAIPVLLRLYLNTKTNEKLRRKHRKKTDLMLEMILLLTSHANEKQLHFLGDSAYTGGRMLDQIPGEVHVTGRISSGVCRLYLAPEREVKVVVVEHLRGGRGAEVFYSTDIA